MKYHLISTDPSAHAVQDTELVACIGEIQKKAKHRCGSPRMTRDKGLGVRPKKAFRVTTNSNHGLPVAENMRGRRFTVAAASTVWVSDISCVAAAEGSGVSF